MKLAPAIDPSAPPLRTAGWEVSLLGAVQARRGSLRVTNFGSRAATALLARLALYPLRLHPREELIEHLWPGVALDVGRNRLRQTLFALRQWLEPAGLPDAGPVLQADSHGLRVLPGALDCDAVRFEAALRAGRHAEARALYAGELLPGIYDDWVEAERLRLDALFERLAAAEPSRPAAGDGTPARAAAPPRASLPTYLTRFFGRDADASRLRAEVLAHRLVSLLGPGGSGKTRLAVELATALTPALDGAAEAHGFDKVHFVPLVNCHSAADVLAAVLAVAGPQSGGAEPLPELQQALGGQRVLLVLDNAEQLGAHAAEAALALLRPLPQLHLLVTSRHVLGVAGEREFGVAPLPLPRDEPDLPTLMGNPAVALFVDRARAARADFRLGDDNRDTVVALVQALAGMPLALELAASRMRSLSCADMLALLRAPGAPGAGMAASPQLDLLSRHGPLAGADPRHASMQRVIDWSWRQLGPESAQLLAALTVFHGGFTAATAGAVCGGGAAAVERGLDDLIAHSLVHVSDSGDTPEPFAALSIGPAPAGATAGAAWRFGVYEPVREFAAAQLAPEAALRLRAAHRAWLIAWAGTLGHRAPLAALRAEMRNLLAALASALADGAPADALRLLLSLRRVVDQLALPAHAIALLEAALQQVDDPRLVSCAHTLLGSLCLVAAQGEAARRHAERGLASVPDDAALRARALHAEASVRWRSSRDASGLEAQLDAAEALALQCGDAEVEASVHSLRAYLRHVVQRDIAAGQALHERALALWQRAGNTHAVNRARYNLAVNAHHARRHAQALLGLQQVAEASRAERDWQQLSKALNVRGLALCGLRRWPEAVAAHRDCIRVAWGAAEPQALAYGLWNLPHALAHTREPEAAARLAGFIAHYWSTQIGRLGADDRRELQRNRRLVAAQIGAAATAAQWRRGEAMTLGAAVALALAPSAAAAIPPI